MRGRDNAGPGCGHLQSVMHRRVAKLAAQGRFVRFGMAAADFAHLNV
jgi:hypothetical protein